MSESILLRPYQTRAVNALRSCRRGIVWAPAGSGKTIIAAAALDLEVSAANRRLRIGWMANTQEQIDQAEKALASFSVRECAEVITRCAASAPDWSGFDYVVVDEAHHAAALGWGSSLSTAKGHVWGLTATPYRADDKAPEVFRIVGPIVCEITREEVGPNLTPASVRWIVPHGKRELDLAVERAAAPELRLYRRRGTDFEDTMSRRILFRYAQKLGLVEHANRNRLVTAEAGIAMESGHSVLVIVHTVDHGHNLASRIRGSEVVFSKVPAKRRRNLIAGFRDGSLRCLISTSLADEGLDVPRASALILACGGRSAAKTEQRTGRVLREFSGKSEGKIIDFWDQGYGMLLSQSRARSRLYQSLGYRELWMPERETVRQEIEVPT